MRNANASPRSTLRAALIASALWAFAVNRSPSSIGGDQTHLTEGGNKAQGSEAGDGWSERVNGLRGRLSLERDQKSPFVKVFIELQNTSDVAGSRKIISGTLTIPKMAGDHPHSDWSGTLTLPTTKIPRANKGEPNGAANQSQPVRPDAIQTSAAAGFGRRPECWASLALGYAGS
jgi:hypothetical protein